MDRKQKNIALGLAGLAILGAAGCKKTDASGTITTSTTQEDSTLPSGWKRVEATGEKLSIGYPSDWHAVDLTQTDFDKAIDSSGDKDPSFASTVKTMAANKTFKLIVMHDKEGDFSPNLNVIEMDAGGSTLDQLKSANLDQLKSIASGTPTTADATVDGTPAVEFKYQMQNPSIKEAIDIDSYLLVKDGKQYILTFTATQGSKTESDFSGMKDTFHAG
jgi:hypothetical protein